MFACIYFKEDSTLSVVNEKDKDLKVIDRFIERGTVEMVWRRPGKTRQIFHGSIVKTGG